MYFLLKRQEKGTLGNTVLQRQGVADEWILIDVFINSGA